MRLRNRGGRGDHVRGRRARLSRAAQERERRQGNEKDESKASKPPSQAKVHSLLPRKLKGMANATASAWAGSALIPTAATRT